MVFVFQYQLLEQKYRWLFLKKNTSKSKPFLVQLTVQNWKILILLSWKQRQLLTFVQEILFKTTDNELLGFFPMLFMILSANEFSNKCVSKDTC